MSSKVESGIWTHDRIKVEGLSLSGIRTAFALTDWGLGFDVAQGYPFSLRLKNYFISHGHLDHAAGIPYIISQKAMHHEQTPTFHMPASLVEPLSEIMRLWQKIEGHEYEFSFQGIKDKDRRVINPNLFVEAFKTVHRIESFGYTVFEKTKKLHPRFRSLSTEEIKVQSAQGQEVNELTETPLFSFTGDTQIEFLDFSESVKRSKVLFLEATYLDESKTIENAKTWGHTHLDEVIARLPELKNEKIVIIHTSERYPLHQAEAILRRKLPDSEQDRVCLFPAR